MPGPRRLTLFRVLLGALALLVIIAGTAFVLLQHSGRARRSGDFQVAGLGAPATVHFDRWGVPHINADRVDDLARALGWVHANDRFTQMELGRRAAAGRLSEILGESTYRTDVYFRTLRFPETAEHLWSTASMESRSFLDAYADGVNAWLGSRDTDLPPALRILGVDPEPWQPRDSMAFALLMAQDLSFWDERPEEERFRWLMAFGAEGVRDLLGDPDLHLPEEILALAEAGDAAATSPSTEPISPNGPGMSGKGGAAGDPGDSGDPGDAGEVENSFDGETPAPGSNNWAIGGSRTESGLPMLANDPHLGLFLPSVWYQVHLRAPGYEAAGMTLPGTPGVVIGRGPAVAWAFTNVMLDDHDIFFEQLDESGERVRRGDEWLPIESETQTLTLRGGETRQLLRRRTDIGPLLEADPERGLPARSVRWTAFDRADPIAALRGLAMAEDVDEVLAAIEPFVCPAQNLVVALANGRLLYTPLGRIPDRRLGDGRMPSPAWNPAYGWDGLRPRESNPQVVDPPEDLIVTANHDIRPPGYELPLTAEFFEPFRADRIRQRLLEKERWSRDDFASIQLDAVSLHAHHLVRALSATAGQAKAAGRPLGPAASDALTALEAWDGSMAVEGPSALFVLVQKELLRSIFFDEQAAAGLQKPIAHRDRLDRLVRGEMDQQWFDDVSTEEVEGRQEIFAQALEQAWNEGVERWGEEVETWPYGELHGLRLDHRLDAVPLYGPWSRRGPFPVAGSATTVLAFGAAWRGDQQRILYGPSMRFIVDWSRPETSWMVLPGGQSGHPADPHYDDQIQPYLQGELHEAPWSEEAIAASTVSTVQLLP